MKLEKKKFKQSKRLIDNEKNEINLGYMSGHFFIIEKFIKHIKGDLIKPPVPLEESIFTQKMNLVMGKEVEKIKMNDIQKPRFLTDEIFDNIQTDYYLIDKLEAIWSLYNIIYLELLNGETRFNSSFVFRIKQFIMDIILIVYSSFSIFFFFRKKKVAIWSGDFYNKKSKGDFRIGQLLIQLEKNKINYIEFIRDSSNGIKETFKNIIKRRRPVIYYNSFSRMLNLFLKKT